MADSLPDGRRGCSSCRTALSNTRARLEAEDTDAERWSPNDLDEGEDEEQHDREVPR